MAEPAIGADDLAALDASVTAALDSGDTSQLAILGHGEISVALGWPAADPTLVCKRTPPFTPSQFSAYRDLVTDYIEQLQANGIEVVDTAIESVERDGDIVGYLVQPLLPSSSIGSRVLGGAEPDADHPFLAAVAAVLDNVGPKLSVDAQVTNFSWDGTVPTLLDVGTPFLWDDRGRLRFEMGPFLRMLPAMTRPLVRREMMAVTARWRTPRGVALDVVANLYREGLGSWVDPMVVALNRRLGPTDQIDAAEAHSFYEDDLATWPRLKRLQAAERWWQTTIRRRRYEFFIETTFGADGERA